MSDKLLKKIVIKGKIILKTGLHIGGTNSSMAIGGIDTAVIRNPLNNQPFIPGSSLKGKMRNLLEVSLGEIGGQQGKQIQNGPSKHGKAANLFGNAVGDDKQRPSRVVVRDCELLDADSLLKNTEIPYTEGKTEVVIDRITSAASPRQLERVPAGAKFALNIVLNIWEQDNEDELINHLFRSLQLVHDDYLGGNGSRGYGQVEFDVNQILEKSVESYYGKNEKAKPLEDDYREQINKLKD